MSIEIDRRSLELAAAGVPHVRATVVRAEHPTSAHAGDAAVVLADGTIEGFVGGECAESSVRVRALDALGDGTPVLLRIVGDAGRDDEGRRVDGGEVGVRRDEHPPPPGVVTVANPCLSGGTIEVFLQPHVVPARVAVVGDTPIGRAVVALGRPLGFDVQLADDPEKDVRAGDAALVVASHGRDEEAALRRALDADVAYIALVASRRRGGAVLDALDLTPDERQRVSSPAGLDIGARSAPEIALSILAELVASGARRGAPAGTDHGAPSAVERGDGSDAERARDAAMADGRDADVHHTGDDAASGGHDVAADAAPTVAGGPATGVDPVCGMTVAAVPATTHLTVDGRAVYFCSTGCRDHYARTHGDRLAAVPTPADDDSRA